ncbi:MAG: UDP-N-acetylglucosamine 2-epimerase (non-hydrolyzing) [Bacteroidetes bacterium]|nr:UDP-N-acetylglucosamine 2-epimerase (non-hydrolyzing) [Bacteroidota bacterium]
MKTITTILGARPQFIKAAPVSRALADAGLKEQIIHTGQHFDESMSEVFFREMEIPRPAHHLEVNSLGHGAMTGRMLEKVEEILLRDKPDAVMVYGDTNSTLAGALAAAKIHIPVIHVESGLRSFDMRMPEEVNRILTDRISSILFCPTATAVKNLHKEGFGNYPCRIEQVGDVMYDSVLFYLEKARKMSDVIRRLGLEKQSFAVATIHRAENTDHPNRLSGIVDALNEIHKTVNVVVPLHPRTRRHLSTLKTPPRFTIIEPLGYFDMLVMLDNASMVLTDSGGLQKEAYFFRKFCITLRDQTEWVELVEAGANTLAGAESKKIVEAFLRHKDDSIQDARLYGNGDAALKIANILVGA